MHFMTWEFLISGCCCCDNWNRKLGWNAEWNILNLNTRIITYWWQFVLVVNIYFLRTREKLISVFFKSETSENVCKSIFKIKIWTNVKEYMKLSSSFSTLCRKIRFFFWNIWRLWYTIYSIKTKKKLENLIRVFYFESPTKKNF